MEIERKFLIGDPPGWLIDCDSRKIEQAYVAITGSVEVRLRKADGDHFLTVKRGHGESREESEVALSSDQFEVLWPAAARNRISKTRYIVPLDDGRSAEVDIYDGPLEGLRVAEVEFESEDESREFRKPEWFGSEVTGNDRYANQSLATDGLPKDLPAMEE